MRMIAGTLKGRRLDAPSWDGLRPTSDKLRETLFNVLAPRIAEASFLDGYAGTGAVGIEALSRGAASVTFVERDPRAVALIESNLQRCAVSDRYAIIRARFADAAARLAGRSIRRRFRRSAVRRRRDCASRSRRRRRSSQTTGCSSSSMRRATRRPRSLEPWRKRATWFRETARWRSTTRWPIANDDPRATNRES